MKPGGLYQDPTMNQSQKSNQTMRSGIIKDRQGTAGGGGGGLDAHMDSASTGTSNRGGPGGLGGFLGGLSGPGQGQGLNMQNGTFQI